MAPAPAPTPSPENLPAGRPEPSRAAPAPEAKKFELDESLIPEKYRSAADPLAEFMKGYDNLNGTIGKTQDELRAAIKTEVEADLFKDRPKEKTEYALPKLEGVDDTALAAHPLVEWWRETAFARGMGQAGFEEGIGKYVEAIRGAVPDEKAERAALGENAGPRLEAVSLWANKTFQGEDLQTIRDVASTAKGVKLLEKLMRNNAAPDLGNGNDGQQQTGDTEDQIKALMASPKYYHPAHRDPAVVARVDAFYAKFNK